MAQGFRRPYSIYSIYAKSKQSTLSQGKLSTGKDQTDMTLPACLPFLFLRSRNRDRHLHQVLANVTGKIRDCDLQRGKPVTIPNLSQRRPGKDSSCCTRMVDLSQKVQHRTFCWCWTFGWWSGVRLSAYRLSDGGMVRRSDC